MGIRIDINIQADLHDELDLTVMVAGIADSVRRSAVEGELRKMIRQHLLARVKAGRIIPTTIREQVVELHKEGKSLRTIAGKVGISKTSVQRFVDDYLDILAPM